jgi:hypothetical protein
MQVAGTPLIVMSHPDLAICGRSSKCGVVWCGVVWCGVVWCGVVWCGVVWCGVVWFTAWILEFVVVLTVGSR